MYQPDGIVVGKFGKYYLFTANEGSHVVPNMISIAGPVPVS